MHALEPQFIPDIHLVSNKDGITTARVDKIKFNKEYQELLDLHLRSRKDRSLIDQFRMQRNQFRTKLDNDPQLIKIIERFSRLGITYFMDTIGMNIAYDSNNHPVYVDQIQPWAITGGQQLKRFDIEAMKSEIESSVSGQQKEIALKDLTRYQELHNEAIEKHFEETGYR